MNEIDILNIFYDELRAEGQIRENLFISLDETVAAKLKAKLGVEIRLDDVHQLADICIANEWLERTTADPGYHYLSLTEAGLNMAITQKYTG